jgi:hypothetical protein
MPTLFEIYEKQAEECLRSAAKTANPKHRDMLLKLSSAWREDAEALKRGVELLELESARRKAIGARYGGLVRVMHLHLPRCGVTAVEWGQTSVALYEPQQTQRTMRG